MLGNEEFGGVLPFWSVFPATRAISQGLAVQVSSAAKLTDVSSDNCCACSPCRKFRT